ncbi:MAG: hypothetical protein RR528_02080 [Angelakisella sp.]
MAVMHNSKAHAQQRLAVMHNLYFYNTLMEVIREHLDNGTFGEFYKTAIPVLGKRI